VLAARDWNVADLGMAKAPPIRLVVGQDRHATIDRAARFLGLGRQDVLAVPADEAGRMLPDALEQALGVLDGPVIVCLQAGEVHTGAFDDFPSLIPLAHARNAWVHVDGAFGLWAAASPGTRSLLTGVDAADSWTTDAHKTLNVPYDSGLAIVRRPEWARAAFSDAADYLIRGSDDPFERTPEFSRRARGFAVWAALRSLGSQGVADLVQRLRDNAAGFAERLRRIPGVTVVNDVVYTQVLFRLESDEATVALGPAVLAEGTCVVTPGTWGGRPVQRCSMSSWATREQDLDAAAAAIERLVA
jgi:glutamate/tyrosine decarboxylase-like PLP-dependent enzyme